MRAIYLLNFQFYCILLLWLFSSAIAVVLDQPGEKKLGFCGNQDNQQIQMASTLGGVRESSKSENSSEIENIARYAVQEHNKKEGLVEESDLHSFNIPIYTPSKQDVKGVIYKHNEGSFNLAKFEPFLFPWDAHVKHEDTRDRISQLGDARRQRYRRGKLVSNNFIRAYIYRTGRYCWRSFA